MLHPGLCTKLSLLSSHKLEQSLKFSVPNLFEDLLDKVGECNNVERFSSQVVKTLQLTKNLTHSSDTIDHYDRYAGIRRYAYFQRLQNLSKFA